jgi:hypothetical protein
MNAMARKPFVGLGIRVLERRTGGHYRRSFIEDQSFNIEGQSLQNRASGWNPIRIE